MILRYLQHHNGWYPLEFYILLKAFKNLMDKRISVTLLPVSASNFDIDYIAETEYNRLS
jgi:hypothetical protein